MKWTRRENPGHWMAYWTSEDGAFEIQKHIGPSAKYDHGHLSGQPYRVLYRVETDPYEDGGEIFTVAWKFGPSFHLLKQAQGYVETFLVIQPSGLTAAEESWNEIVAGRETP